MSEQRLIDASRMNPFDICQKSCIDGAATLSGWVALQPTIDPETLPIVQELRAQLCKEERESQHWKECYSRVCNDNWVAKKKLARYEQGGWISIKEDLPRVLQNVLVFRELGLGVKLYDICMFFDGRFFNKGRLIKNVTHWMPLPEQPKED